MRYATLGRTGIFVSELCFGSMTFGGASGMWEKIGTTAQDEADRLVGLALDAGINFFETPRRASACAVWPPAIPPAARPEPWRMLAAARPPATPRAPWQDGRAPRQSDRREAGARAPAATF